MTSIFDFEIDGQGYEELRVTDYPLNAKFIFLQNSQKMTVVSKGFYVDHQWVVQSYILSTFPC